MTDFEQKIELYLSDAMSKSEKLDFENEIKADKALMLEYDNSVLARKFIRAAGRLDIKEKLIMIDAENKKFDNTAKPFPHWIKQTLKIAAVLVISLGIYYWFISQSDSAQNVFSNYFTPYDAPSTIRDTGNGTQIEWRKAFVMYKQKNYAEAIKDLGEINEDNIDYISSFYKGVSYLSLEEPDIENAIANFDRVLSSDNDYNQQAQWYKALALLHNSEKDKAKKIFEQIVEQRSYNYNMAAEILKLKIAY